MIRVVLPDFLQAHTGEGRELLVSARSYGELIAGFEGQWPGFAELVAKKATTVIDGEIVPDPRFEEFGERAEVCFLPKISAG